MGSPYRSVRVEPRDLSDRSVLAVASDDHRIFDPGERVFVVADDGSERVGVVLWDPVARWVVAIEERGSRLIPW